MLIAERFCRISILGGRRAKRTGEERGERMGPRRGSGVKCLKA